MKPLGLGDRWWVVFIGGHDLVESGKSQIAHSSQAPKDL